MEIVVTGVRKKRYKRGIPQEVKKRNGSKVSLQCLLVG